MSGGPLFVVQDGALAFVGVHTGVCLPEGIGMGSAFWPVHSPKLASLLKELSG
jgi:hypothetical protein